ncbi:hypothetical protein CDAR_496381 [Caerostris darwini]|uniref:Uncharacterized protein n=1 Tax=Caerostris darwini TaxID=1538125 RepID=A0AAV4X112_9ARAC|nr:hypothetical protein CDAR_496381 [Caerostris darwini]
MIPVRVIKGLRQIPPMAISDYATDTAAWKVKRLKVETKIQAKSFKKLLDLDSRSTLQSLSDFPNTSEPVLNQMKKKRRMEKESAKRDAKLDLIMAIRSWSHTDLSSKRSTSVIVKKF